MKCPKCQFENPEGLKFCGECGTKLEKVCPKCNFTNPAQFKFCGECGHSLAVPSEPTRRELSFDEKLKKIQKYLPKGITEKILSQRDKIEGERKQVTVMFCDMEGFTSFSAKLGPEEVYSIMDEVYEILIRKVNDFGGTVNELTGDGILAIFGAPIALEDAAQRGIRSAIAIHREMSRFSDIMIKEKGIVPIRMRIGIHSGPVVVGTVGNDLRVEFKAIGDTVNLASRMQSLAEPGTTYITENTFKLTEGLFTFENLGDREVKGEDALVRVYRVLAPSSRRTRFDASAERGLTPLVGRKRELEILQDAFRQAKEGRGQAVAIVCEAGMGKSRLLYEFRNAIANEDATFLEGKCLSYSKSVPYHSIIDILKSSFRIQEGDRDQDIRERVKIGLEMLGIDFATASPYLLELLAVKDSGIAQVMISPEANKERIIDTLNRVVLNASRFRPLILAIEDLHWMDTSSGDVIKAILHNIPAERVLLLLTYRPQFTHDWGTKSYLNQINLPRLSDGECLTMTSHLLRSDSIEKELQGLFLEKTEGVPFFVEEFVHSFKEIGIIKLEEGQYRLRTGSSDMRIPSNIQDVIMSRVDALPESAKEILKIGSAIEREFSYELIKRTASLSDEELISSLSTLKTAELLYQRGTGPESTYIFRHALTMEVIYDSILSRNKRELHRRIGEAIEELYKDSIEEQCATLARHFIESGLHEKAARYSESAAKRARRSGSYGDAIAHSIKRISSLEQLPKSETIQKQIIDARTVLASHYIYLDRCIEARNAVDAVVDTAIELDYKKRLPGIFVVLGSYYYAMDDLDNASKYLKRAIDVAQNSSDWFNLWNATVVLGTTLWYECEFEKALECYETSLRLSEMSNNSPGISYSKIFKSTVLTFQGRIFDAYKLSKEAVKTAEACGDAHTKGKAYSAHGSICFFKGDFENAERFLKEAIDLCQKSEDASWRAWAGGWLASTYHFTKKYKDAEKWFSQTQATVSGTGQYPSWKLFYTLCLQRAIVEQGATIDQPFPPMGYRGKNKFRLNEGIIEAIVAEILTRVDPTRISEAEKLLESAITSDGAHGTRWYLAMDYRILSEVCRLKGDRNGALGNLSTAINIMRESGADGWVRKYEEEMVMLS